MYNRSKKGYASFLDPDGFRRLQRNVYQERRDPFRKSQNKKGKCTEEIENGRFDEDGRERSLVYKKGTSREWEAEARRGRGRRTKLNIQAGNVHIHPPALNKDHLTCFYCNADNILNKRTEFETTLIIQKPDIIYVTEYAPKHTMLNVQDVELHVDGYDLCTNKRGPNIYRNLPQSYPCVFSCDFDKSGWVGVKLRNKDNLLIGYVYRSPNSNMRKNVELMTNLKNIT